MVFIERLSSLLQAEGLTNKEFLSALQLNKDQIRRWKKTEDVPPIYVLVAIATYFGVTVEYLLGETDEPYPETRISSKTLSDAESKLISDFRSLNKQGQELVLQVVNAAVTTYKKDYSSAAAEESGEAE